MAPLPSGIKSIEILKHQATMANLGYTGYRSTNRRAEAKLKKELQYCWSWNGSMYSSYHDGRWGLAMSLSERVLVDNLKVWRNNGRYQAGYQPNRRDWKLKWIGYPIWAQKCGYLMVREIMRISKCTVLIPYYDLLEII